MELWEGRERHASPYGQYRTVPGWNSSSHTYTSRSPAAPCPESRSEFQGWMGEPSSWMIPGSRTAGTMRDYVNWTDMAPASNCPPENLLCSQELAAYGGQERSLERQRALLERYREKERLVQRGEATNRRQTCSSTLSRREKEKLSANSYRELEAWANRYYHSLPRQRHLDTGTWNATQSLPETERMSRSAGRLVSPEPNQRPLANTSGPYNQEKSNLENRLRAQLEAWKTQKLPPYVPVKQSLSRKNMVLSPSFSQPPNYMSPPPYSGPQDSDILQVPGKCATKASAEPVMEYRVESRPVSSAFPMLRRSEHSFVPLTESEGRQHVDHPSTCGIQRTVTYRDLDKATLSESLAVQQAVQEEEAVTPHQSSHQLPQESQTSYLDETLSKQSRPKRRRGGETVFCLVSRMGELAGLSSSPDEPQKSHSLPLLNIPTHGGPADVGKQSCERQKESEEQIQLADEVDSGSLISSIPEIQVESQTKAAEQILKDQEAANKEKLQRELQETFFKHAEKRSSQTSKKDEDPKTSISSIKEEETIHPCASSKTAAPQVTDSLAEPPSQTTVKFPLWKEPKWHYCSKGVSEKKNEPNQDPGNMAQKQAADKKPKKAEVKNNINTVKDKGRGLVVIDATCVVVKVEFIFPPEKEHVQYVCSRSRDSYEHSPDSLILQVQNNDHTDTDTPGATEEGSPANNTQELHVEIREQHDEDLRNRSSIRGSSHIVMKDPNQLSNEVISENETLQERAERILGITLQTSSNEGNSQEEAPQTSRTEEEEDVQRNREEPGVSSEADHAGDRDTQLTGVGLSENIETSTKETEKEEQTLTTETDGTVEGSEVDHLKTIQTHEVRAVEVMKQENEETSEDKLDEKFSTQRTDARADPATATTQQLNHSLEGNVSASPSNEVDDSKNLLPSLRDDDDDDDDDGVEKTTQSFDLEGSPSEGNPCETGDVNSVCPALPADLAEDTNEMFVEEGTLPNNMHMSLCPTFLQDLPEEGNSSSDTDGANNLGPVLPGDSEENIGESIGREGSFWESEPSDSSADGSSLHPPLPGCCRGNTSELLDQEDTPNLSVEGNDDLKNLCSPLHGNSVESTAELSSHEGTLPETDDIQNLCPALLGHSVESTSGLFNQEASSREDIPSNPFGKKDLKECNVSDETDGLGLLDGRMENSCQRLGLECSIQDAKGSNKTDPNVCLSLVCSSVEDTNDQEGKPEKDTPSKERDDASQVLPYDSGDLLSKEGRPGEGTEAPCPCNSEENESQLFGQEDPDHSISVDPEDLQNLCQTPPGSSEEDTSESDQERPPREGFLSDETEHVNDPCFPTCGREVANSSESSEPDGNEDDGEISLQLLHLHTDQESTSQTPPEPPLSESPQRLGEGSLLEPPLTVPSCSSPHSEHQPELPSPLSSDDNNRQPSSACSDLPECTDPTAPSPLTPALAAGAQPPESSFRSSKCRKKPYPASLLDAVNRIRKHTAPDSENEEEDGAELWDQMENTGVEAQLSEDTELQLQEAALEERMGSTVEQDDGSDQKDVLITIDTADRTAGKSVPLKEEGHLGEGVRTAELSEERRGRAEGGDTEDDTVSSSSLDSHGSNDTVIEGEGNGPDEEDGENEQLQNEELDLKSCVLEGEDDGQISEVFKDNQ